MQSSMILVAAIVAANIALAEERWWQFRGREARHVAVVMEPRRLPASTDNVEA